MKTKKMEIYGQSHIKEAEIRGQTELKARELIFGTYQDKIKASIHAIESISQAVATNSLQIHNLKNKNEKSLRIRSVLDLQFKHYRAHSDQYNESLSEIENSNIINDAVISHVNFIRKTLAVDLQSITDDKIEGYFYDFFKAFGLLLKLERDLLERKSLDLFSKYL